MNGQRHMVLNELSCQQLAADQNEARQRMRQLVATIRKARGHGVESLRSERMIFSMEIANGYPISKWVNDSAVDHELRRYFKTIAQRSPFIDRDDPPEVLNQWQGIDLLCDGVSSAGLRAAWLLDGLAVSLRSSMDWDRSVLHVMLQSITDTGELEQESETIRHASIPDHIIEHATWLQPIDEIEIELDGRALWAQRDALFPDIQFSKSAGDQIIHRGARDPLMKQVAKRLRQLSSYFQHWTDGGFDDAAIGCRISPDSPSTRGAYGETRMFSFVDGDFYCEWHCRLTPNNWRIYFFPDPDARCCRVGYIGPELPTTKYPT